MRNGHSRLGQSHRAWPVRSAFAEINPLDRSFRLHDKGYRVGDKACPVTLVPNPDRPDQLCPGIAQKAKRIGIQRDVWTVFLAVARYPFSELSSFFRGFDADTEDLDFFRNVSFRLVNKGRHLGPTPGSPPAPVEENNCGRRLGKDRGKLDCLAVDILKPCSGKFFADL